MPKIRAKLNPDGTLQVVGRGKRRRLRGRIDPRIVDQTSDLKVGRQKRADDLAARKVAAAYARRVRRQTGLTQAAFAARIGVPIDTIRNWEQGKRVPAGPAKALLKVIHRTPETVLAALK